VHQHALRPATCRAEQRDADQGIAKSLRRLRVTTFAACMCSRARDLLFPRCRHHRRRSWCGALCQQPPRWPRQPAQACRARPGSSARSPPAWKPAGTRPAVLVSRPCVTYSIHPPPSCTAWRRQKGVSGGCSAWTGVVELWTRRASHSSRPCRSWLVPAAANLTQVSQTAHVVPCAE